MVDMNNFEIIEFKILPIVRVN